METINNELTNWLQQLGVAEEYVMVVLRIGIILAILIVASVVNKVCKRIIIPAIRKVTAKTQSVWDDHLLSDEVLGNACQLIPPILVYALLPLAFPEESTLLTFILKLCWIYITIVGMKLICAFLSSLYSISSEHEKLKNHSLKGFYQMLKLG